MKKSSIFYSVRIGIVTVYLFSSFGCGLTDNITQSPTATPHGLESEEPNPQSSISEEPNPQLRMLDGINPLLAQAGSNVAQKIRYLATDHLGGIYDNQEIVISIESGDAEVASSVIRTNKTGMATADVIVGDVAGGIRIKAEWLPNPFQNRNQIVIIDVSSTPGVASQIEFLQGEGQCGETGKKLREPFRFRVTDAFGNPVAYEGTHVSLTRSATALGENEVDVTTDQNGEASLEIREGSSSPTNPEPVEFLATITLHASQNTRTAAFGATQAFYHTRASNQVIQMICPSFYYTPHYFLETRLTGVCGNPRQN